MSNKALLLLMPMKIWTVLTPTFFFI